MPDSPKTFLVARWKAHANAAGWQYEPPPL